MCIICSISYVFMFFSWHFCVTVAINKHKHKKEEFLAAVTLILKRSDSRNSKDNDYIFLPSDEPEIEKQHCIITMTMPAQRTRADSKSNVKTTFKYVNCY